ncbi:MAG TPA: 5-formyltetrahydrofolate cyclo-ligase [Cycloclasticus sp.]|jgi:5-formyltetrahydrofolate cyclo-ligase|nr:5-formyltetrahydrofolate cyclo-ligase [Cycloclasticus sp.]HIL92361.1 5-formyltetrahydrofolate cyclo-ligase [Cycloclasticus sp.]
MQQSTSSLRQSLRKQRQALSKSTREHFDYSIQQTLLNSGVLLRFSSIAGYLSNNGEPSIHSLIQTCSDINRPFYLPVLKKKSLAFASYTKGNELTNNAFNIPEPSNQRTLAAKFLSVILVPLVGFDHQGNRLGMGGGFYDHALNFMLNPACTKRPLLIGIAYSLQKVDSINRYAWDIPLDAVITEEGLSTFSVKARQLLRP